MNEILHHARGRRDSHEAAIIATTVVGRDYDDQGSRWRGVGCVRDRPGARSEPPRFRGVSKRRDSADHGGVSKRRDSAALRSAAIARPAWPPGAARRASTHRDSIRRDSATFDPSRFRDVRSVEIPRQFDPSRFRDNSIRQDSATIRAAAIPRRFDRAGRALPRRLGPLRLGELARCKAGSV